MEYIDLVDDNDNIIGTSTREFVDSNNLKNYRVVNILVINSKNEIVLAQRSKNKKYFGGCYFFSVGGHVKANESYEEAAYRELKEELGIINEKLQAIAHFSPNETGTSSFSMLYFLKYNGAFIIDKNEIEQMKAFKKSELEELLSSNPEKFSSDFLKIYEKTALKLT